MVLVRGLVLPGEARAPGRAGAPASGPPLNRISFLSRTLSHGNPVSRARLSILGSQSGAARLQAPSSQSSLFPCLQLHPLAPRSRRPPSSLCRPSPSSTRYGRRREGNVLLGLVGALAPWDSPSWMLGLVGDESFFRDVRGGSRDITSLWGDGSQEPL